jgi:hypothetical protein
MKKITEYKHHSKEELFISLQNVRLRGFDRPYIYRNVEIVMQPVPQEAICPPQSYVLSSQVARILDLYRTVKDQFGYDIFNLTGYLTLYLEDGSTMPVLPPILEQFDPEDTDMERPYLPYFGCLLVCDGMHRLVASSFLGIDPVCIITGKPDWPYYSYPQPSWDHVQAIEDSQLDAGFEKKRYRLNWENGQYKWLYRDFNEVFPGVQAPRPRSTQ